MLLVAMQLSHKCQLTDEMRVFHIDLLASRSASRHTKFYTPWGQDGRWLTHDQLENGHVYI